MRSIFLMKRRGVGGILSRGCLSDQGGHPKRVAQEGCLEEGISVSFKGAEWLNELKSFGTCRSLCYFYKRKYLVN